jgi:hypothetical protein
LVMNWNPSMSLAICLAQTIPLSCSNTIFLLSIVVLVYTSEPSLLLYVMKKKIFAESSTGFEAPASPEL